MLVKVALLSSRPIVFFLLNVITPINTIATRLSKITVVRATWDRVEREMQSCLDEKKKLIEG